MAPELRNTGISVVGNVPWGTHLCHFYETKEDLLDILIPYFNAGLENNELCVWVVSDPLGEEEAKNAFRQAVPEADRYLTTGHIEICSHSIFPSSRQQTSPTGRIEIVPHTDWYLKGGAFVAERIIEGWNEKLADALAKGYAGLRGNGNEAWLTEENRKDFIQYEKTLDEKLADQRMIVLCSYPLSNASAAQVFDVVNTHQLAVIRRHGNWEILETPEVKRAKQEIQRLNEELEQRVRERTKELETANEKLGEEIKERKRAEEQARKVLDTIPALIGSGTSNGILDYCNQQWLAYAGVSLEELQKDETLHPDDKARVVRAWQEALATGKPYELEQRYRRFDGVYRWFLARGVPLKDAEGVIERWYGTLTDIEDRKQAEEALRGSENRLRLVLETLPVGVAVTNRAGDIVLINAASKRIWGGTIAGGRERWEQTKAYWHDSGQRIAPESWASVQALSKGETSLNELIDIETYDGQRKIIRNSAAPVRDSESLIVGAVIVNEDVTNRVRAEEKLKETSEQLRSLSARLQSAREEESKRIAREIHDELGGALTTWKWDLEEIYDAISEPLDSSQVAALRTKVEAMTKLTETTLDTVRKLASELRPTALELGLVEAIEWQLLQFESRTGIEVRLKSSVEKVDLDDSQAIAVFRILQEALTNIQRHAQATKATITVNQVSGQFLLTIQDNGRGFTKGQEIDRQALGLLGMRERVHLVGGEINIESAAGEGTKITVRVPLVNSGRLRPVLQSDS